MRLQGLLQRARQLHVRDTPQHTITHRRSQITHHKSHIKSAQHTSRNHTHIPHNASHTTHHTTAHHSTTHITHTHTHTHTQHSAGECVCDAGYIGESCGVYTCPDAAIMSPSFAIWCVWLVCGDLSVLCVRTRTSAPIVDGVMACCVTSRVGWGT